MKEFKQIFLEDLTDRDFFNLELAVSLNQFGHTVEHILGSVAEHSSQLWRGTNGKKQFIMITQIFNHPAGSELRIWSLGGQGYLPMIDLAGDGLKEFGKKYNCKWLTGKAKRKAFEKLYKRFNYTNDYQEYIVEI